MSDKYSLRLKWSARQENASSCAVRVLSFLGALETAGMKNWCEMGFSRSDALSKPVKCEREWIVSKLLSERNRTDQDKRIIESLGFDFQTWMPGNSDEESAILKISCGGYSQYVKNGVTLRFPERGIFSFSRLDSSSVLRLFEMAISCWDPDEARVIENEQVNTVTDDAVKKKPIGFILFIKDGAFGIGDIPKDWTLRPINGGSLIYNKNSLVDPTLQLAAVSDSARFIK